ncbi:MAG: type II toxin-antitoxin system VapC family toxin [Actinomycetota bacterium]|nr:type II toxin-antitoxin system VapC family toxin [Actinomycetota bacterium]
MATGGVDAVTSAEVIREILHRFTGIEHRRIGIAMARHALDLFAPVLPITHEIMGRMPSLVQRYPRLAARDLVHVATCAEAGIESIVSPDRAFDTVDGLRRIDPGDAEQV